MLLNTGVTILFKIETLCFNEEIAIHLCTEVSTNVIILSVCCLQGRWGRLGNLMFHIGQLKGGRSICLFSIIVAPLKVLLHCQLFYVHPRSTNHVIILFMLVYHPIEFAEN